MRGEATGSLYLGNVFINRDLVHQVASCKQIWNQSIHRGLDPEKVTEAM